MFLSPSLSYYEVIMYQFRSRVRYSEVNSEKKLTLASLLDYLQDCSSFEAEDMEIGVDYLASHKISWVLASWEIEILRYPAMGEQICVNTWPYGFKGFYGYRNFSVTDAAGEFLVKANSVWVYMDLERMHPVRISEEMIDAYRSEFGDALAGDWSKGRLKIASEQLTAAEALPGVTVTKGFIDTNHHVNNGKYVQVAEQYLPDHFYVRRLRVEYKKAAAQGAVLCPYLIKGDGDMTCALTDGAGQIYAIVDFVL